MGVRGWGNGNKFNHPKATVEIKNLKLSEDKQESFMANFGTLGSRNCFPGYRPCSGGICFNYADKHLKLIWKTVQIFCATTDYKFKQLIS